MSYLFRYVWQQSKIYINGNTLEEWWTCVLVNRDTLVGIHVIFTIGTAYEMYIVINEINDLVFLLAITLCSFCSWNIDTIRLSN